MRFFITSFLCLLTVFSSEAFAATLASTVCGTDAQNNVTLIKNMYATLDEFDNTHTPAALQKVEAFFAPDITYIMNEAVQAKNLTEFDTVIANINNTVSLTPNHYKTIIAANDKVVMQYSTILGLNNNSIPLKITSIFTLKNGKITKWSQEVNENNFFL